ncbi:MAG: NAD(P)H-dependent oxidoreductase [Selenomonadales bacterium]|nr:NAD(P)H-dependent oxidoreductase [Selenomonadales bacterium]
MPKKILVAYFSHSGNTRLIGKAIAREIGADIEEIVPVTPYPLRGAWLYLHGGHQAKVGVAPPLQPALRDFVDYDLIIVGTPVWAGSMAPPVRSFFQLAPLEEKTAAYFSTYLMSEAQSLKDMVAAGNATSLGERGFKMTRQATNDSVNAARQWAKELLG